MEEEKKANSNAGMCADEIPQVYEQVSGCCQKFQKFVDTDFRTTDFTILVRDPGNTKIREKELADWQEIEWKRPSEFMEAGFRVFDNLPSSDDIN